MNKHLKEDTFFFTKKNKLSKLLTFLLALLLLPATMVAQDRNVTGSVVDPYNDPLIGVTVSLKNTTKGTLTDIDGKFSIDVPANSQLVISYIGHKTMTVDIKNKTNVGTLTLEEDTKLLNEVVVVGYGTMEKRQVSSSISSLRGDDLVQGVGGGNITTALQGKITGLTITGTSSPNSGNAIQLRGVASVNAGKGPLVVIDGVPGGDIRSLNQEDIASIDVLKDASAGAIYGTRAAGGVILITTKQAKEGPIRVTYTGELSMETLRARPELLTAKEFLANGLGGEDGRHNFGADTDWYDVLMRNNPISNRHVLNIAGGSDVAKLYTTFTAQDQKGISLGDGRKDYSGRINTHFKIFDGIVEVKTHSQYREAIRDKRSSNGMYNMAMQLNPTVSPYDAENPSGYDVNKNIGGTDFNPLADVMLRERGGTDRWLSADASIKINLTKDLYANGTVGYESRDWQATEYVSAQHRESLEGTRRGQAYHEFDKRKTNSFDAYLNYSKTINVHTFSILGGYSYYQTNREYFNMKNTDFPIDGIGAWDMGTGTYLTDGKAEMASKKYPRERLLSFFGRANYSLMDKYVATLSVRHEGSSKFGPNHRFGTFWAISGGWHLNKEKFMKDISFINDLKLRLGYGVTGNNDFESGLTTRTYKGNGMWLNDGKWDSLYGSGKNMNPDLKWEEKAELNFGVDYSMLNNRLFGKFDLYKRNVSNLIYEQRVPQPPSVYPTTKKNIGTLENFGWEFEIGGTPVQTKDIQYTTSIRFSQNTTKIKSMGNVSQLEVTDGGFPSPGNPGNPYILQNDMELGQWYMKKHAGIDDDGNWLVYDKDDNIILAEKSKPEDRRFLGNAMPKLILSWDHTFNYKQWDLSVFLRSWIGFDVLNMADMYYGIPTNTTGGNNFLKKAFSDERKNIKDQKYLTDYWLEDGSFLKIDAIVIGYNLNMKKYNKFLDRARFYLTMRDIACFTGYSGLDPEVETTGLRPGTDAINQDAIYPKTRRFTLGVQLTF